MRFLAILCFLIAGPCLGSGYVFSMPSPGSATVADSTDTRFDLDWSFLEDDSARWGLTLTSGFDAFVHTFPLATSDTTETIAEYLVQAGVEGRSAAEGKHRWNIQAESSMGTQLFRERLEAGYRLMDESRQTRFRFSGSLMGRQYRRETEYTLSSDNAEGRLDLRTYPLVRPGFGLETRGWGAFQSFRNPSTLEVDHRDLGGAAMVRSRGFGQHMWNVGTRLSARSYPDSVQIGRLSTSLDGGYDFQGSDDSFFRFYHRSDRRRIKDETVKPSAWGHWSDLEVAVPVGGGRVFFEIENEVWAYDQEMSAYFDSWRIRGFSGFGWGEVLATRWRVGLATGRLEAGSSPETYSQFGLRGQVEAYGRRINGSLTVEYGQRLYDLTVSNDYDDPASSGTSLVQDDFIFSYSDFSYVEIWLLGSWRINDQFSFELLANYQPERHTESMDDLSLGFGSLRLVWKP